MKIQLISYGDDNFKRQKEFLRQSAEKSSFFDEIKIFGPEDISTEFAEEVGETLISNKGGGYWLWKPFFVRQALDRMQENDVLIYCDAGCLINPNAGKRFGEYINMLSANETSTIDFELPLKEYEFTKQEVFHYFNASEKIINSNQLMATVIILKKCAHTCKMVEEWFDAACDNPFLFTDEVIVQPQHIEFVANRYDQSVFSIIRKQHGANILSDETYFLDFVREGYEFPFWAARLRR